MIERNKLWTIFLIISMIAFAFVVVLGTDFLPDLTFVKEHRFSLLFVSVLLFAFSCCAMRIIDVTLRNSEQNEQV